jgi:hypothetical protein
MAFKLLMLAKERWRKLNGFASTTLGAGDRAATTRDAPRRLSYWHCEACGARMNREKDPWTDLLIARFREDCEKENMTDMDALCAWRMGIGAYKAFRGQGGTLPHDTRRSKR